MFKHRWFRFLAGGIVVLLVVLAAATVFVGLPALRIGTGYAAKIAGSGVFVGGRDLASLLEEELGFLPFVAVDIDRDASTVRARILGLAESTGVYRPGLGVTLAHGEAVATLPASDAAASRRPEGWEKRIFPHGGRIETRPEDAGIDYDKLDAAVADAFQEPKAEVLRRTRAVVVVHRGKLVAEQYAPGFDESSMHAVWSVNKSVINALLGTLVQEEKLDIFAPAAVPEWDDASDPRHAITTDQLLRMSSGLAFSEEYFTPFSNATQMLFGRADTGGYAASLPLAHEPETVWYYSSGTTNLLSRLIRHTVGEAHYRDYPRTALFDRIGMHSALLEPDASGTFVGSSFGWATARDWARFGLLFLNDGIWNGERILPEGWVEYSTTLTAGSGGRYGAHWWLNRPDENAPEKRRMPSLPEDVYYASGFEGQRIFVIPSHDVVVVRLGLTQQRGAFNYNAFLSALLEALPE